VKTVKQKQNGKEPFPLFIFRAKSRNRILILFLLLLCDFLYWVQDGMPSGLGTPLPSDVSKYLGNLTPKFTF
jgi:hypothetical protein